MKKRTTEYHFAGLAAFLLFGIFAVCVAVVLLVGVGAYRRLTVRDKAAYDRCTCMQYIATRVHQAEGPDQISVEKFGSQDALVFTDSFGCVTRVYYYDGHIMELYTEADNLLSPEAGESVMEVCGLEFALEDGLLTVTATHTDGVKQILRLSLSGGEEADL